MSQTNLHQLDAGATESEANGEITNSELRDLYRGYLADRGIWAEGLHPTTIEGQTAYEVLVRDLLVPLDGEAAKKDKERYRRRYHSTNPADVGVPLHPLPGVFVPYQSCLDGVFRCRVRWLRREYVVEADKVNGTAAGESQRAPRWDSTSASAVPWFRALPSGALDDADVALIIVEAPVKALAMAQYGFAAVAMASADSGLHDPDSHEGRLNQEAGRARWLGRCVSLMLDAGQAWNPMVALGVARAADLLRQAGALVRICQLPPRADGNPADRKTQDQGPDDYAADVYRAAMTSEFGDHDAAVGVTREAIQRLIDAAVPGDAYSD